MIPKRGNHRNRLNRFFTIILLQCLHVDSSNYELSQGKTLGDVCNLPVKTSTPVPVT